MKENINKKIDNIVNVYSQIMKDLIAHVGSEKFYVALRDFKYTTSFNYIHLSMNLFRQNTFYGRDKNNNARTWYLATKKDININVQKPELLEFLKQTYKAFCLTVRPDSIFNLYGCEPKVFFELNKDIINSVTETQYKDFMKEFSHNCIITNKQIINKLKDLIKKENENQIKQGENDER